LLKSSPASFGQAPVLSVQAHGRTGEPKTRADDRHTGENVTCAGGQWTTDLPEKKWGAESGLTVTASTSERWRINDLQLLLKINRMMPAVTAMMPVGK